MKIEGLTYRMIYILGRYALFYFLTRFTYKTRIFEQNMFFRYPYIPDRILNGLQ